MKYYICTYSDYTDLPIKLFCDHNIEGMERKSIDGSKFIARCKDHNAGEGCLSWMNGDETPLNHAEIIAEIIKPEWTINEEE
jgi:hypothetical protein